MAITLIIIALGIWVLYSGFKLYRSMNWNEPPESTPDFGQMRKREAELLHIQDVLQEAHKEGKLSAGLIQEFDRFCEAEIGQLRGSKQAWDERPKN